jgi:hypothetical protein
VKIDSVDRARWKIAGLILVILLIAIAIDLVVRALT